MKSTSVDGTAGGVWLASQCNAFDVLLLPIPIALAFSGCADHLQTWVEGVPVKGISGKPAKPSRAAALQILQQLASQHCQRACPSKESADAAVPSHTAVAPFSQDAESAVNPQTLDSQPEVALADDSHLVQPQLLPALDTTLGDVQSKSAAQLSGGVSQSESDSEAELNLRGRVASDEEDDRQGPGAPAGPVAASGEGHADQALLDESSHAAAPEADLSSESALARELVPAGVLTGIAGQQPHHASLSKVMRQQQRRMLRSRRHASSQPDVVLVLTEAQQQRWQPEDGLTCNISEAPTRAEHDFSMTSARTVQDAQLATGQDRLYAQRNEQSTGQREDEQDEAGPSSRANGQDEHQLWQNLAEALQDKQSCQKLAQLTVMLLGRM